MKYTLFAVAVTLVATIGFTLDTSSRPNPAPRAPSREPARIYAPGRVEGATTEIELRPQLFGRVVSVFVTEGQFVQQGDILLQLDDEVHRHQVDLAVSRLALAAAQLERLLNGAHVEQRAEAAAMLRAKESELKQAELTWTRAEKLLHRDAIAQQEADDNRSRVASLSAEVDAARSRLKRLEASARPDEIKMEESRIHAARANLELTRVQLERSTLRAPQSGQILKVDVEVGELTGPESQPTVIMADTRQFFVRAFIEEMDAPQVALGMPATITADGLPNQTIQAQIVRLSPRMTNKALYNDKPTERYDTKTREIWLKLETTADLIVGLRVDVVILPTGESAGTR